MHSFPHTLSAPTESRMLLFNSSDLEDIVRNDSTELKNVEQILVPVLDAMFLGAGHVGQSPQSSVTGTGTDILLLALSAADMLLLTILPFHTVAIAMQHWPFGDVMCRLVSFLGSACSTASVFTLATLAVSRYLTVVKPAKAYSLLTRRRVSAAAAGIWVPACCLAAPQLFFRSVGIPRQIPDGISCFAFLSPRDQLIYGLCHFLVAFLLPLVTIAVAYSCIYIFIWRGQHVGRAPQVERYQSKVTQTSAMLVLAFTVCWLPSYGLTLALLADKRSGATGTSPRYGWFSVFARLMAVSSTVVNPILYVLMSEKFREDLLNLPNREKRWITLNKFYYMLTLTPNSANPYHLYGCEDSLTGSRKT
uniref:G-protein coupled receptors family 1 profile domain-containing protein n=1 Tax=Gouania willdenowi TaxID=441366 RepID=A0A8C5HIA1_GOUWI